MAASRAGLSFVGGTLVLEGFTRQAIDRIFDRTAWTWDERIAGWRCHAIAYADVRRQLKDRATDFEDRVPCWQTIHWKHVDLPRLRPEQEAALAGWLPTQRGVVVMPTGTGKTEVALAAMSHTAVSTLVVAPIRDLMYQWHRRILRGLGYDAGIIGDAVYRVAPVSVTTYDSACIHMERLGNQFGLIVFDECHHLPGPMRRDAALMCAAPQRLGLTATPERADGRHVDTKELIGPVVYELDLAAVRGHSLANYEVIRVPVHLSADEQTRYDAMSKQVRQYVAERRRTDPQFSWQDLCADTGKTPEARRILRAYYMKKSIEDRAEEKLRILEDIFRLHIGSPMLIFAGSNAMARDVSRRFLIPCLLSHCRKKERLEILEGLSDGTYPAVVANRVLDEGVDVPAVKVAVVIGGTASTRQAKQRLGRLLRKSGNIRATLYEVVTADTKDEDRSRKRRKSDAYQGTRHRRI